jgi:hypothetical protein
LRFPQIYLVTKKRIKQLGLTLNRDHAVPPPGEYTPRTSCQCPRRSVTPVQHVVPPGESRNNTARQACYCDRHADTVPQHTARTCWSNDVIVTSPSVVTSPQFGDGQGVQGRRAEKAESVRDCLVSSDHVTNLVPRSASHEMSDACRGTFR